MEVSGKVIEVGEVETFGEYSKKTFVINTGGQYPVDVAFDCWGARMESVPSLDEVVDVKFNVKSRKGKNGGWFTSLNAQSVDRQVNEEDTEDSPF